ncbi:MAG: BCAM0308 family protein [Gemmatimonadota bacterium]
MARTLYSPASRKNVDRETDPYIPRKTASEIGICPKCRAICRNKRWVIDEREFEALTRGGAGIAWRRCPACRKIEHGFPSGVVTLSGGYLRGHRDDILNLIRNEDRRAMGFNPLERIISMEDRGDALEIATTDEKLAQRIGREVRKACRGTVEYKWSEDSKLLRVNWAREE